MYRDQEFSADMGSRAVKRIEDVRILRAAQFPEDNGPMSHPIRPEKYAAIDNFYTATVYEKGAEVCRMYASRLYLVCFSKRVIHRFGLPEWTPLRLIPSPPIPLQLARVVPAPFYCPP